jgi:hypothetical protein
MRDIKKVEKGVSFEPSSTDFLDMPREYHCSISDRPLLTGSQKSATIFVSCKAA